MEVAHNKSLLSIFKRFKMRGYYLSLDVSPTNLSQINQDIKNLNSVDSIS